MPYADMTNVMFYVCVVYVRHLPRWSVLFKPAYRRKLEDVHRRWHDDDVTQVIAMTLGVESRRQ